MISGAWGGRSAARGHGVGGAVRCTLIAALILGAGCDTRGQLLVVIDSDLVVGEEIGSIDVSVREGMTHAAHRFEAPFELPLSFGAVSASDGAVDMHVSVSAWRPDQRPLVQRSVATTLQPGRILRVDVPLARACADLELECGSEETCVEGACATAFRAAEDLPEGRPGEPPPSLFEGPPAMVDGGMPRLDGGVARDAGPGCVNGEECQVPGSCMIGMRTCSGEASCVGTGRFVSEGTSCGQGRVCDADGQCG